MEIIQSVLLEDERSHEEEHMGSSCQPATTVGPGPPSPSHPAAECGNKSEPRATSRGNPAAPGIMGNKKFYCLESLHFGGGFSRSHSEMKTLASLNTRDITQS